MRIGYVCSQYPAASHTFIRREVEALRLAGLAVETFTIRPGEAQSEVDRAELARTFCVLGSRRSLARSATRSLARAPERCLRALSTALTHRPPGAEGLLKSGAYCVEALRLAEELERRGVTHVHNHFANAASHASLAAARSLGLGWSVTLHGLTDFDGPLTPLLPDKVRAARFVATVTHYGRERTLRLAGHDLADKVSVVRCGIDVARLPRPERREPTAGQPLQLLAVGRLSPEKGQVGLVEAFALALRRGLHARLAIIGAGPEEARIRAAIAAHGLADRVELRGRQPEAEVLRDMARAHVLVVSSFMEGLPVVLMEALGLELPVIAPAVGGIPELVIQGETGLLFQAGDWAALAGHMTTLAGAPALRARLAAAGRTRVQEEFDLPRAVAPLVRLFEQAHGRARPQPEPRGAGAHTGVRSLSEALPGERGSASL